MSRGGGRGGKRARPQIRAKGEDEDGRPLSVTQPKPEDFQPPPLYPPLPSAPQPFQFPSDPSAAQYLATGRALFDHSTYGGYRLSAAPSQSVRLERYSDRYRRLPGQRSFLDECPQPSLFLFPAELQRRWERGGGRAAAGGAASRRWLPLSAEALQSHLDRLTVLRDEVAGHEGGTAAAAAAAAGAGGGLKAERADAAGGLDAAAAAEESEAERRKRGGAGDEDEDEDGEKEDEEREDDEDDDMGGGDYTDRYQEDDDGEGDDVFGDDDGDVF